MTMLEKLLKKMFHEDLDIHCREACDDFLKILKKYKLSECPGVIYCFTNYVADADYQNGLPRLLLF